jgi:hypothetical protein
MKIWDLAGALVLRLPTHHIVLQVFFSLPGRSILIGLPQN